MPVSTAIISHGDGSAAHLGSDASFAKETVTGLPTHTGLGDTDSVCANVVLPSNTEIVSKIANIDFFFIIFLELDVV